MIANALILTIALLLALGFWLMGELKFLIPYRHILVHQYGEVILAWVAALFTNVFAAVFSIQRKFFLKDTGRKLTHIVRTMQRVLSSFSKDKKPPFSQSGLAIPERDKLQMKIRSRRNVSFSWAHAEQITSRIRNLDGLGDTRREQYSTLILLAAASGLRSSELLALRINDVDFKASTIRVDESSDQRNNGTIGPCKNAAAYRTVLLHDPEGKQSMRELKHLLMGRLNAEALVFRSQRGGPLLETTILNQGLYPALKALGLPQGGVARVSTGMQPALGTGRNQTRRHSATNGT